MPRIWRPILFILLCCLPIWPALAQVDAPNIRVRAGIHDSYNRLVFDWDKAVDYSVEESGRSVRVIFDRPGRPNLRPLRRMNPPYVSGVEVVSINPMIIKFTIPDGYETRSQMVGQRVVVDIRKAPKTAPDSVTTADISQAPESPPVNLPQADEPETEPVEGASPAQVSETSQSDIGPSTITFRLIDETAFAAIEFQGNLWVIANRRISDVPPSIQGPLSGLINQVQRVRGQKVTAFRFPLIDGQAVEARKDGLNWQFVYRDDDKVSDPIPLTVMPQFNATIPFVTVTARDRAQLVSFEEPANGITLSAVAVTNPREGMPVTRQFPDFDVVAAPAGALILPYHPSVVVEGVENGAKISRPDGLRLTSEDDTLPALSFKTGGKRLFDLIGWQAGSRDEFNNNRRALDIRLSRLSGDARAVGFIDLARLYLANGFGAEAAGALTVAESILPSLADSPDFRALRGAGYAINGDLEKARQDLTIPALATQTEAKLWLAYVYAVNHQWARARPLFKESGELVLTYPPQLMRRIGMVAAESDLRAGDVVNGTDKLNALEALGDDYLNARDYARLGYLRGLMYEQGGDLPVAMAEWGDMTDSKDRLYSTKARLKLINARLSNGEITKDQAIEALEGLRYTWRGDRLEIQILRQLGQLYVDTKQIREGLNIWRTAAELAEDDDTVAQITNTMGNLFQQIYTGTGGVDLPPLQALALYDEFDELRPAGPMGIELIMALVDRLVAIDLLNRAETLLSDQINYRLEGVDKAKAGLRLAGIYLIDNQPEQAIRALDQSVVDDAIPTTLVNERTLLRARALSEKGDYSRALAVVDDLNTNAARRLKADINWQAERYGVTATILATLIDDAVSREERQGLDPLEPSDADLILKRAFALSLAGDSAGLANLAGTYGIAMKSTDRATLFKVASRPPGETTLADLKTLQSRIAEVDLFEQAIQSYRQSDNNSGQE